MTSEINSDSFYNKVIMGEYASTPPVIHRGQAKLIRRLDDLDDSSMLDIGSGAGIGASLIAHAANIKKVTCIDLSVPALRVVQTFGFSALVASAEGAVLPFPNETFDIVVIDEVIEHLVDTDSIMDEIHRVLKPTGQLVISTPNLASWFNRIALLFGIQPAYSEVIFKKVYGRPGVGIVGHLRLFTRRALNEFVSDKGFTIRHSKGVPFPELPIFLQTFDRLMSRIPSIAGGLIVIAEKKI